MIGLFAITQILKETKQRSKLEDLDEVELSKDDKLVSGKEVWEMKGTILGSAV